MVLTSAASPSTVTMPDPNQIRDRLGELCKEANFLRRLLRLMGKRRAETDKEKNTATNSAR